MPSIHLAIQFSSQPLFPRELDMDQQDYLTGMTYKESFKKAQEAKVPYYSIAIVETQQKCFEIYDAPAFANYALNKQEYQNITTPLTNKTIRNVYYFAIPCFKFNAESFCKCSNLNKKLTFQPMLSFEADSILVSKQNASQSLSKEETKILLDSINYHILDEGRLEHRNHVRREQKIIAQFIQQKKFFVDLEETDQQKEVIKWLWCSSDTHSLPSVVALAQACLLSKDSSPINLQSIKKVLTNCIEQNPLTTLKTRRDKLFYRQANEIKQKITTLIKKNQISS